MKQFEKNLLLLQKHIEDSPYDYNYNICNDTPLTEKDYVYLQAKGLVLLSPFADDILQFQLTDYGITYFDDKKDEIRKSITSWSFNFGMAVLSAICGSIATLLIQQAFIK